MKILHVITGLGTGGAERALYNLLHGGIAKHFNNHIVSLRDLGTLGEPIRQLGVPVTPLGMRRNIPSISRMMQLRHIIQTFRPDILQGWMYHGNLAAALAATLAEPSTMLLWNIRHSLINLDYEKFFTKQVIRINRLLSTRPATLLYNSQVARKQHEAFGFAVKQGKVIPNGIDIERFGCSDQETRKKIRNELAIPDQDLVVGHVARFHPMKDHALFLRAAVEIAQWSDNVHFILIGRNVTRGNREISPLIPEHFSDRFHLLGERSRIPALMTAMDIFTSSSYGEGFPNVIGEAMATRLPCVVTDVGDSGFLVDDTGKVIPPRDKDAMVAGLLAMLGLSGNERKRLGKAARKRIVDNFSLNAIVDRYSELYNNVLMQKKGDYK